MERSTLFLLATSSSAKPSGIFKRTGIAMPISQRGTDYQPGNVVTWMLPGNLPHIGIIVSELSDDAERRLVVHNMGLGPVLEDMIFDYKLTGHYRYNLSIIK